MSYVGFWEKVKKRWDFLGEKVSVKRGVLNFDMIRVSDIWGVG